MAKKRDAGDEAEKSRRKDPEDLVRDPYGHERERVTIRLRKVYFDEIERRRGDRTFGATVHDVIEAGLRATGWKPPKEST